MFTSLKLTSVEDQSVCKFLLTFSLGMCVHVGRKRELISTSNFSECPTADPARWKKYARFKPSAPDMHLSKVSAIYRHSYTRLCLYIVVYATRSQLKHN